MFLEQETLGAELDGIVVPAGGLAIGVGGRRGALVLDGIDPVGLFFDEVQLARQAQRFGGQGDAARVNGVALLARAAGQAGVVDAAVLDPAVLDVLVDDHQPFDVLQPIQTRAVGNLIQRPHGNQLGVRISGEHSVLTRPPFKAVFRTASGRQKPSMLFRGSTRPSPRPLPAYQGMLFRTWH